MEPIIDKNFSHLRLYKNIFYTIYFSMSNH